MTVMLGACEPSAPSTTAAIASWRNRAGRDAALFTTYKNWEQTVTSAEFTNAAAAGAGVIVTLEPRLAAGTGVSLTDIAAGTHDAFLTAQAAIMAAAACPVILRFAHEMNGSWYPWGTTSWSAAQYIAAYRKVVTIFRAQAPNVDHFWCPNVNPPDAPTIPFSAHYPGAEHCDYVGLDGYNWVAIKSAPWQTLDTIMGSSYDVLTALAPGKPIIIGETSCNPTGGDKPSWIAEALLTTVPTRMPAVVGVCWFDFDRSGSGEADWRIDSNAASQAAFRRVAADPVYGGTVPTRDVTTARVPIKGAI